MQFMQPFFISNHPPVRHCLRITVPLLLLLLLLFAQEKAWSFQNNEPKEPATGEQAEKIVRKIRFSGNDNVRSRTLRTLIRTRTNREMLGIPRFTPWYYIHRLTGRFGEAPVLLDRETVASDLERIRLYYENIGFFRGNGGYLHCGVQAGAG